MVVGYSARVASTEITEKIVIKAYHSNSLEKLPNVKHRTSFQQIVREDGCRDNHRALVPRFLVAIVNGSEIVVTIVRTRRYLSKS